MVNTIVYEQDIEVSEKNGEISNSSRSNASQQPRAAELGSYTLFSTAPESEYQTTKSKTADLHAQRRTVDFV